MSGAEKSDPQKELTQNTPEEIHVIGTSGKRAERTCLKPFLAAESNKKRLVMMNHLAQESRPGSVFAERRALGVCAEMSGYGRCYMSSSAGECQGFALYPHQHVMFGLLHRATGSAHRLRDGLIHRFKQLNADG